MRKRANKGNYTRVLRKIWLSEGISRIEIADYLGLDKSTITNITAALQRDGIITEMSEGDAGPQGGRKPIKLKIEKNFYAAAGIEVQPDCCNVICINLLGEVLFSRKIKFEMDIFQFPIFFSKLIKDIKSDLNEKRVILAGAGIGVSGIVNPEKGAILESIPLGINEEFPLLDKLSAMVDVPVFIDNDGNCCCWGELVFNRAEQLQDFIYCFVEFRDDCGVAIGLGVAIDGKVHYGRNYSAGEFRSVFMEGENSGQIAILNDERINKEDDSDLFEKISSELGRNIALLVNTFALSDCFIGGDLTTAQLEIMSRALRTEFNRNWSYPGESECRIRASSLRELSVAYGAASMIIDSLFRIPAVRDTGSAEFDIPGRII
ncbi:MAG TPA: hypothetical protein DCO79_14585 [Spirochaeta sp.]|nr:hypothetical protein [Spirochaeta sp.]